MGIFRTIRHWWTTARRTSGPASSADVSTGFSRRSGASDVSSRTNRLPVGGPRSRDELDGPPDRDAAGWIDRARLLERAGRRRETRRALLAAGEAPGADRLPDRDIAYAALRSGRLDAGLATLRRCIERSPDAPDLRLELAWTLEAVGDTSGAEDAWRTLSDRQDAPAEHIAGYAGSLVRVGRLDDADSALRTGLARHPASAALHSLRGAVLHASGRGAESLQSYEAATRIASNEGDPTEIFVEYAIALCAANRVREGAELLVARLPDAPSIRGHQQLATAALTLGEFDIGWPQLEHRWLEGAVAATRPSHALPPWRGQDLRGRTLLVRAEQGIGDTIQFSRYLTVLKSRGARILYLPLAGMVRYSARFPGQDRCVPMEVDVRGIDYYIDLMSIPGIVGTTLASIPPVVPPGPAPDVVRSRWARRLGALPRPRVGLVWAGRPEHPRDRERSIPFARFASLLEIPGIQWLSLQKGEAARQSAGDGRSPAFIDLAEELATLDDAAEAITHLDVLVCVDTALGHLAGSLGTPVWMMVPRPADCRWLEEGDRTAWYPSMRLFRQERPGDWDRPLDELRSALERLAGGGMPAGSPTGPDPLSSREASSPRLPSTPLAQVIDTRCGLMQMLPDRSDEALSLWHDGEWRSRELALVLALARPGDFWLELGASFGSHAIPLARAIGGDGELLAWDDHRGRRRVLANNVRTHGLGNVTILPAPPWSLGEEERERPGMPSIDDLGLDRLDGLKASVPIDGMALLEGARRTLRACRPSLVLAVDAGNDVRELARHLHAEDYRTFRLDVPLHSPANFFRRSADVFDGRAASSFVAIPDERRGFDLPGDCVPLSG
jgi:tetratricopeptide (TPR) repeat protein